MKRVLLRRAIKLNNAHKRRRNYQRILQMLSAFVVFCTTYALILPAITMEQERLCGLQTHVHESRCYESYPYYELSCTFTAEPGTTVLHSHGRECYDREGKLRCGLAELPAHRHDENCYGDPVILCGLTEGQGHVHSESCTTEKVLTCGKTEGQIHLHDTTCSQQEKFLSCTVPEGEGHTHSEGCAVTQQVAVCGLEETQGHTHSESCTGTEQKLICTLAEAAGHTHGEGCTDAEGNLTCTEPEQEGHSHTEACFETVTKSCDLPEIAAHTHTESCFETQTLSCGLPETPAHTHGDGCYSIRLTGCAQPENVPHVHEEACYEIRQKECTIPEGGGHTHTEECFGEKPLICKKQELQPHLHDENCYDAKGVMSCTLPQILEHVHGKTCLTETGETLQKLICTLEEHEHEDLCYADGRDTEALEFLCGYGEHTHGEGCLDENGQLICTIPEHAHSAACVIPDLDLTADAETRDVWDDMFRDMPLTGNWPEDLVAVAQSQLNYRESSRNCCLEAGTLHGYSRYGARYDQPYSDWNSLFIRFCMDYAGVRYYPWLNAPVDWISVLRTQSLFCAPDNYIPQAGDLIFFCRDTEALSREGITYEEKLLLADHVGIVSAYIGEENGTPAKIRTIEGDVKDRVCNVTYDEQDLRILGYGRMLPGFATEMGHSGEDYTIALSFTPEAQIPRNARLTVREILPEEESYESYYRQSVVSLLERTNAETEEELGITFARYFDIGFTVNGSTIEPAAPVSVRISYAQPIAVKSDQSGTAVHFAGTGVELLDAALSGTAVPAEEEALPDAALPDETLPDETLPDETVPEETVPRETEEPAPVHIDTFAFTQNSFSVLGTVLANARVVPATVWLDGTCGNLMAFEGSPNSLQELENGCLPTEWPSPTKYQYVLKGWYDITNGQYYAPGALANVNHGTVFYADWIAASYDIGQYQEGCTLESLDTNEFVTTHVFDYNTLFNMHSVVLTNSPSSRNNQYETWNLVELGDATKPREGNATLDFVFRDHDGSGSLSRPAISDGSNTRNEPSEFNRIYDGLYTGSLYNTLFDPGTKALGKTYLGQGNYLFQYNNTPDTPYYGYYYYDSSKNAASYNAGQNRFYVYDYRILAQDTIGNNLQDQNADFLPLNYTPYNGNQIVYASQRGQDPSTIANFNFGMRTNIHFYLPNASGSTDSNGNYLNKSTTGDPMIFEFSGDDDVWVLLDGKLLLDIGGIHQVRRGVIDFSEGVIRTTRNDSANLNDMVTTRIEDILGGPVPEGGHDLTICYLERGSSMSNCAIYFNLAPRYGLDLNKRDYITNTPLPGVTFGVYTDPSCSESSAATLWTSHQAAKNNESPVNTFLSDSTGLAHMWGFVAGKTYYIKELSVPDGYPMSEALIRVTLNNHGTDISEITVIRPETGSEGFEVISHSMNKENHLITISLTNKRTEDPLTDLRAEKYWGQGTVSQVPVQVYLMANGQQVGETVTLSMDNAWGHTWMDLPLRDAEGKLIDYLIREVPLDGHYMQEQESVLETDKFSWVKVGALENNANFLLAPGSNIFLMDSDGSFGSLTMNNAQSSQSAQWTAVAYQDGFRLRSGSGRYLAFRNADKSFYLTTGGEGNQTFYYDGEHLFVMASNIRYYVAGLNGSSLTWSDSPVSLGLYKQIVTHEGTTLFCFTNTPIPQERQRPLTVEKIWDPDVPYIPEQILVHVKHNGVIQATLELNGENGWKDTLEGLDSAILEAGGYTLEEEAPFGFLGDFGEITDLSIDEWHPVTTGTPLVKGETYVFITGTGALADDNGVPRVTGYIEGHPARNQRWQAVEVSGSGKTILALRNLETQRYFREYGPRQNYHEFTLVSQADNNCETRLYNSRLQFFLQDNGGGWSVTVNSDGSLNTNPGWGANAGTAFTVFRHEYRSEYHITLTNTYATYVLPKTGGVGTASYYTFGGLLILAAALMYTIQPKRRRQKGGR